MLNWFMDTKGKTTVTYRIVVLGLIVWMALGGKFVSKEDYLEDKKKQHEFNEKVEATLVVVSDSLILLKEQYKVDEIQDEKLSNFITSQGERNKDFETRLRSLEKKK